MEAYIYYIDIVKHIASIYNMPHKADTTVICQCGAMVCKYYMPKQYC